MTDSCSRVLVSLLGLELALPRGIGRASLFEDGEGGPGAGEVG
jgi:hypothetical protein